MWSKAKITEEIREMSNDELLDETIALSDGDDYDGCHTSQGWYKFGKLQEELYLRLHKSGWLKENNFNKEGIF